MMKGLSPTQRTLRALKEQGRISAIVEKWNRFGGGLLPTDRGGDGKQRTGIRQDLFSFIDLLALDPQRGIIGIQCCAGSGHAAHRRKILEDAAEFALEWLKCSGKIELWSWSKRKLVKGGKAERWTPRIEPITLADFQGEGDGDSDPTA